jgi:hypothetical protein
MSQWAFLKLNDTIGQGLIRQLKMTLEKFGLTFKILCYVKGEGTNLGTMTTTLKSIISCEAFNLLAPLDGACFGHAMSKIIQYAINDDKVSKDLGPINVKSMQTSLQPCITWPKKFGMLMILNLGIVVLDFGIVVDCR